MQNIIRLYRLAWRRRGLVILTVFAVLLASLIDLAVPAITRFVISTIEAGVDQEIITVALTAGGVLLAMFLVKAGMNYISSYYAHVVSWNLVVDVRCQLYQHFQTLSMGYYQDKQTGSLMARVLSDSATFENLLAHALPDLASNLVIFLGVLVVMLVINPLLAALVCIPVPLIALFSSFLRKIRRQFQKAQAYNAELSAVLQDNFSGIKEIQLFNQQHHALNRVGEKAAQHKDALLGALRLSAVLRPSVGLVTWVGTVIVLVVGPIFSVYYNMPISDVVAFMLYLNLFYAPVATFTRILEDIQEALAGADRVFEILDTPPEIQDSEDARDYDNLCGSITFDNVSFAYDEDTPVLDNVSFSAQAGEMVALVGPTGVGKSTILSLIARFYEPSEGRILLDDIDTRAMTLRSLRNQMSVVLQDVFLFNGTIAENIAYGAPGATPEMIVAAAKTACIHSFIDALPLKYRTIVGERGVRLSGGQKQRIAIARSALRDAPLLVLDEATSAVDTETERNIQDALENLVGKHTLIVIAHRLSTIRKANRIIVLQNGKIVEQGKHDELIAREGVYAKLYLSGGDATCQ